MELALYAYGYLFLTFLIWGYASMHDSNGRAFFKGLAWPLFLPIVIGKQWYMFSGVLHNWSRK